MYPNVLLFIDGTWTESAAGRSIPVPNPATGEQIGTRGARRKRRSRPRAGSGGEGIRDLAPRLGL